MAVNSEISDIVKKCKILLLDIEGTTTSISFVKDNLFPYAADNVKDFLLEKWEDENVKEAIAGLRKLSLDDQEKGVEGHVAFPAEDTPKEEQIEGIVSNVKWLMSGDRKAGPLKLLQGLIWKRGYESGEIKGHVYDDVSLALENWRSVEGQKVYIYSSGSVQAQKLLFGQSTAGNLLEFIDGHFDTAVGAKQEVDSYKAITENLECKPEEILFLTDIVKEGEAARSAGINAIIVVREGNAKLDDSPGFPILHSFAQLAMTNKRKTEAQSDLPAKVAKLSNDDNTEKSDISEEKDEKMEVEENCDNKAKVVTSETIDEEVTDADKDITSNGILIVEEVAEDKTDKIDSENGADKDSDKNDINAEETPPSTITITEIEKADKQSLTDVGEIIEDLEPIVEEPAVVDSDMTELHNVGEVLQKECDEILSKVHDVTNLLLNDNITIKPLLPTLSEESIEAENADSNDIVERILDSEIELEMKQNTDINVRDDGIAIQDQKEMELTSKSDENTSTDNDISENGKPKEDADATPTTNKEIVVEIENPEEPQENNTSNTKNGVNGSSITADEDKDISNDVEVNGTSTIDAKACISDKVAEINNGVSTKDELIPAKTDEQNGNSTLDEVTDSSKNTDEVNGDSTTTDEVNGSSTGEDVNGRLSVENGKDGVNGLKADIKDDTDLKSEVQDIKVKPLIVEDLIPESTEQTAET